MKMRGNSVNPMISIPVSAGIGLRGRVFVLCLIFLLAGMELLLSQETLFDYQSSATTNPSCMNDQDSIAHCIEWLYSHPIGEETVIRSQMHMFIREWAEECPGILLFPYGRVSTPLFRELHRNSLGTDLKRELLMAYLNGMIGYLLKNPEESDLVNVQEAGIMKVIWLGKRYAEFEEFRSLRKYNRLLQSGLLRDWIGNRLTGRERSLFRDFQEGRIPQNSLLLEEYLRK